VVIAPLAIYVLFNIAYSFKGFVIDTDPGNIFFWLALGLMIGLDQSLRAASREPDPQPATTDGLSAASG
jgi:hypothetical protein